jgi:hypothetical protein
MPRLSFLQLTKIFAVGILGYALLLCILSIGTVILFPNYVRGTLDVSPGNLYQTVFYFLGVPVLIASPFMLAAAWCVLHLFKKRV